MTLRKELFNSISKVIPKNPGFLVLHSSFSRLSPPSYFNKWDALYSIKKLVNTGWTIALPAFTFSFCKSGVYSFDRNKSETGIYADWVFEEIQSSLRTHHPIYSFVLVGKNADLLYNLKSKTTWGEDSLFEKFEDLNANYLMLGCDWQSCTQIHRYEEVNKVPYRFYKYFEGLANYGDGFSKTRVKMFVRNLEIDPKVDMNTLSKVFDLTDSFKKTNLFKGQLISIETKDIAKVVNNQLSYNEFSLIRNPLQSKIICEKLHESLQQPKINVAVLGHSNLSNLEKDLSLKLKKYLPERRFSFYSMPFGQFSREIMQPNSGLRSFKPYIKIFTSNISDLAPMSNKKACLESLNNYINQIKYLNEIEMGWNIIFRFHISEQFTSNTKQKEYRHLIDILNQKLEESFILEKNVLLIDLPNEAILSSKMLRDRRLWYMGKFPFSREWDDLISDKLSSFVISILGKSIRAIILDLDNTLWGGVLGEDGIEGLAIGGDFPGNVFYDFQKALLEFYDRGIALTIVSKNDEESAINAINNLKMPINIDKVSSYRISWNNKFESIQQIASELNLGLDSFLFVDDNPVEREQIKQFLPEVRVLELPKDPVEYSDALSRNPYVYTFVETLEDKKRIDSFKQLKELKKRKFDHDNYENYLKGLKMHLHFIPLSTENINRAAQLCQKTNQFNTTTKRYTLEELESINKSNGKVIVIGLESKNTELENIGLLVIEEDLGDKNSAILQLYLLSCRVLGRSLEKTCLAWCINYAKNLNYEYLIAKIIKNKRNIPVHNLFEEMKFEYRDNNTWSVLTKDYKFENKVIEIIDHFI